MSMCDKLCLFCAREFISDNEYPVLCINKGDLLTKFKVE